MQDAVQQARSPIVGVLRRFMEDDRGASLVEYVVIMASLSVLMMAALSNLQSVSGNSVTHAQTGLTTWSRAH
jgi:Flp pilus assembly pilin Flp